jgi:hypothetical protein
MRPIMRPCSGTSLPAADDPPGVPVSVSPQVGGLIISRCGAHDDGTGLIGVREPQMNRDTALRLLGSRSSSPRTPARHTDGRITGPSSPDGIRTILADHQSGRSEGLRTRGRVNAQLRPFIIRVMRQVMRQMMRQVMRPARVHKSGQLLRRMGHLNRHRPSSEVSSFLCRGFTTVEPARRSVVPPLLRRERSRAAPSAA